MYTTHETGCCKKVMSGRKLQICNITCDILKYGSEKIVRREKDLVRYEENE